MKKRCYKKEGCFYFDHPMYFTIWDRKYYESYLSGNTLVLTNRVDYIPDESKEIIIECDKVAGCSKLI